MKLHKHKLCSKWLTGALTDWCHPVALTVSQPQACRGLVDGLAALRAGGMLFIQPVGATNTEDMATLQC